MNPDLIPVLMLGPWDGTTGPFGGPHMPRLILPACPARQVGDSGPRVAYLWVDAATAWYFERYLTPSESALEVAFGEVKP